MEDVSNALFDQYAINTLLCPTTPYGPTQEHKNYGSGFIHIPQNIFEAYTYEFFRSLSDQGIKKIIMRCGCGGHHLTKLLKRVS